MNQRERLPDRRFCETFKIRFNGQRGAYHVTLGRYNDRARRVGEIFISTNRVGTAVDALARDAAILLSLCLQHGVPIETMQSALTREADGRPSTIAGAVADAIGRE